MKIALNRIMDYLHQRGAGEDQIERARTSLPALVETRDYGQQLQDLGVDVAELTSAEDIPGPDPDHVNPEATGPVGAPDKAQPSDPR